MSCQSGLHETADNTNSGKRTRVVNFPSTVVSGVQVGEDRDYLCFTEYKELDFLPSRHRVHQNGHGESNCFRYLMRLR